MYNNPNFFGMGPMYYSNIPQKVGLLSKLKSGINWGGLLTNTSKTLNVINQAIPVFYQIKPLFQNAKTMFKIADIIRSDDMPNQSSENKTTNYNQTNYTTSTKKEEHNRSSNQPTFFL